MPALPTPDEEAEEHQEEPSRDQGVRSRRENHDTGGEGDRDRRPYEHRAAADPVAEPPPEERARNRAETGGEQDSPALPIGQRPLFGQRRGDVADQKEVEKIEQIRQVRCADQLPLIDRQFLLLFQELNHDVPPAGRRTAQRRVPRDDLRRSAWMCPTGHQWPVTPANSSVCARGTAIKDTCASTRWPSLIVDDSPHVVGAAEIPNFP